MNFPGTKYYLDCSSKLLKLLTSFIGGGGEKSRQKIAFRNTFTWKITTLVQVKSYTFNICLLKAIHNIKINRFTFSSQEHKNEGKLKTENLKSHNFSFCSPCVVMTEDFPSFVSLHGDLDPKSYLFLISASASPSIRSAPSMAISSWRSSA